MVSILFALPLCRGLVVERGLLLCIGPTNRRQQQPFCFLNEQESPLALEVSGSTPDAPRCLMWDFIFNSRTSVINSPPFSHIVVVVGPGIFCNRPAAQILMSPPPPPRCPPSLLAPCRAKRARTRSAAVWTKCLLVTGSVRRVRLDEKPRIVAM